ncbi:hypothetical protein SADUNF_Sadunf10G0089500 [Salix dunnii]|uniref:J domain-containing protein n=1 Tax=Salix dunnii TaxID=1413687 RepID=A0A835JT66_9ROSI|nr:hypothetical protein SADUNF_Sadunf10G0089500 [Salix dunnii]
MGSKKTEITSAPPVLRRDPYEVLSVSRDSTDQEIKTAYRKLALKYHPDKNASNPEASELFKEVAYSYSILSDPEKRRQYDSAGFEALDVESMDMEIDLSNLGTVNTVFAALFSKLGVPIKTTISANVLEEALNGTVTVRPLPVGTSVSGKVEKQCAHFFGVTINEQQAEAGIVVRITSATQSKFKLCVAFLICSCFILNKMPMVAMVWPYRCYSFLEFLVLDRKILWLEHLEMNFFYQMTWAYLCSLNILSFAVLNDCGHVSFPSCIAIVIHRERTHKSCYSGAKLPESLLFLVSTLASSFAQSQEDSEKTGKVTSAGMYFLHFQVYRMDSTVNALAIAKDPDAAFFKRLEGLQPCEVSELKAGTHIFAVYGDNFFKTATYTIEALCAKTYEDTTEKLKDIETQILRKRNELRQFETEYRKALARFQEVTNRYSQEKQSVDELLKQRDSIHASFTVTKMASYLSNGSTSKVIGDDSKAESPVEDGGSDGKDKSSKKKWFNLNLKGSEKK